MSPGESGRARGAAAPGTGPGASRTPSPQIVSPLALAPSPSPALASRSPRERGRRPEGKARSRREPRLRRSRPAGGRSRAVPGQPGRTEVQWSLPNSPACFSFSLPLPTPHLPPPPRLFPPSSDATSQSCLFVVVVLELASRWPHRGATDAGEEGGLGAQPAAHRRDPAGQIGGQTDRRPDAPSALRSSLSKLLLSVSVHARGGGLRPARRDRLRKGLPLDGGPRTQIRVSFRLRNC